MPWSQSTVSSVAALVRGQINADPDAPGGSVPDRLLQLVRAAGIRVWNMADWDFRSRSGTLTVAATNTSVNVPNDFGKLDAKWMKETDGQLPLQFFSDPRRYQRLADEYASDDTGQPAIAIVQTRTAATDFEMEFVFKPTADDAYTFPYRYMARDPWSVPSDLLADDASPKWPPDFDEGWRLLATAMAYYNFAPGSPVADRVARSFKNWASGAIGNLNETITGGATEDLIEDGYNDFGQFMSSAMYGGLDYVSQQWIPG